MELKPKPSISLLARLLRGAVTVALAAAIFLLGVGVGQGKISLGRDSVFHKSENAGLSSKLDLSSVQKVYDTLRRDYDGKLTADQLLDGLKQGLATAAGDPYTVYMNSKAATDFSNQLSGTFSGIGAELGKRDNNIVVISPLDGFPAQKAGLKPKDIIESVDGKSTTNLGVDQVVTQIRGPAGSKVTLKVVRNNKELSFTITRATISIPSVKSKILPGNIGYLQISRFGEDTADLSTAAANKFKAAHVHGIILDLRGDPGGLLDSAVKVSSLWLPSDKTVLTERRGGQVIRTYQSDGTDTLQGIPTVVLIDGGSASASEITAGALRDNKVATLMGEKSFGKGSVQQVEDLNDGSVLKVTIARWYTPGGKNIDKEGITPDKVVKISDADIKAVHDSQLLAAEASLK